MGMYTELIFGARLTEQLPSDVVSILEYMTDENSNDSEFTLVLPNHPFFQSDRWKWLFKMGSYYFGVNLGHSLFKRDSQGEYILSTRSNLKNYTNEIESFLDWIKPYITAGSGTREFYAIVTYEEADEPTIYYLREKE